MSTFVGKERFPGFLNAQGLNAEFNSPFQLAYSTRENCFLVADMNNNIIRKVSMDGRQSQN